MIKRIEGPTPNGGAYAEAIYEDETGFECDIKDAKYISILEYDDNGKCIMHTLGLCKHKPEPVPA